MTTGFLRCPDCSSAVRPAAPWCSLCHADLRSDAEKAATAPPPVVQPAPAVQPEPVPDLTFDLDSAPELELAGSGTARSGRHARRGAAETDDLPTPFADTPDTPVTAPDVDVDPLAQIDVEGMLAALGQSDPLTKAAGRFSSKSTVAMFAFGGAAALTLVGLVAMFILGSFLH